uniref:Uncharacterized protein n=1 Tax=Ciona savignyi TaxID=51511 RepID=H2YFE3_CIOSA
ASNAVIETNILKFIAKFSCVVITRGKVPIPIQVDCIVQVPARSFHSQNMQQKPGYFTGFSHWGLVQNSRLQTFIEFVQTHETHSSGDHRSFSA